MKRALFAIALVLLVTFVLAEPSPLIPWSPFATSRLAFFVGGNDRNQKATLYLFDLAKEEMTPLIQDRPCRSPFWSPDGKQVALGYFDYINPATNTTCFQSVAVIDIEQERVADLDTGGWGGTWHWTSDGRYALYSFSNNPEGSGTAIFDIENWELVPMPGRHCSVWCGCHTRYVALSPAGARLILPDATLIDLSKRTANALLQSAVDFESSGCTGLGIGFASWSPNGNYLLFMAHHTSQPSDNALYLALGDGSNAVKLIDTSNLKDYIRRSSWDLDRQSAVLETSNQRYMINIAKQEVEVFDIPENLTEGTYHDYGSDSCDKVSHLISRNITSCWSPDKALLAVGTEGALKIYDTQLNLLYSIPVTGTVQGIAWSPIP